MYLQSFELFPASFRGIPFLMSGSSSHGGRKTATHEFVNSDKRYTEDLGLQNRTFTLTALISGDFYIVKRNALIDALNTPGIGLLTHPFEGILEVTPTTFSLEESTKSLGTASFTITFERSQINSSPAFSLSNLSKIFSEAENAIQGFRSQFSDEYDPPVSYPTNFQDSKNKIDKASELFTRNTQRFASDPEFINNFQGQLSSYKEGTVAFVSDGDSLANSTSDLLRSTNDLASDSQTGLSLMQTFFNYGEDDNFINANTLLRAQRKKNRALMNIIIQAIALAISYTNAASIDYTTVADIDSVSQLLESQYLKVIQNEYLSESSLTNLNSLRSEMFEFFKNAELTAFKLTSITTKTVPISVLAYQYYGSVDNVDTILDLNNINSVSFVDGDLEVLTV